MQGVVPLRSAGFRILLSLRRPPTGGARGAPALLAAATKAGIVLATCPSCATEFEYRPRKATKRPRPRCPFCGHNFLLRIRPKLQTALEIQLSALTSLERQIYLRLKNLGSHTVARLKAKLELKQHRSTIWRAANHLVALGLAETWRTLAGDLEFLVKEFKRELC